MLILTYKESTNLTLTKVLTINKNVDSEANINHQWLSVSNNKYSIPTPNPKKINSNVLPHQCLFLNKCLQMSAAMYVRLPAAKEST